MRTAEQYVDASWPGLKPLLVRAREYLEIKWSERHAELGIAAPTISHDMCGFTADFLNTILEDEDGGWNVVGGAPMEVDGSERSSGGMLDDRGQWRSHYWLVDECEEFAIDLTADQFGYSTIEIRFADDPSYDANFDASEIVDHMRNCSWRSRQWLGEWRTASAPLGPGS